MLPSHTHRLGRGGKLAQFRPQLIVLSLFAVALFVLWPSIPKYPSQPAAAKPPAQGSSSKQQSSSAAKVPVELFVMSMCPDARFCESHFLPILKQLPSVASIRTEYIATLDGDGKTVSCMHGQRECVGNKLQLCLQANMPADKNIDYMEALKCHAQGDVTAFKELKTCMAASGVPADVQDKVEVCAAPGRDGDQLMVQSAKIVKEREVKKSCTVYIAGTRRCIRDGGMWYNCPEGSSAGAFIKQICDAHKASSGSVSPECEAAIAANPYVPESPKPAAGRLLQASV